MQENKIKEAKVTKSQTSPILMTEVHDSGMQNLATQESGDQNISKIKGEIPLKQPQAAEKIEIILKKAEYLKSLEFEQRGTDEHTAIKPAEQSFEPKGVNDVADKNGTLILEDNNACKTSLEYKDLASVEVTSVSGSSGVPLNDVRDDREESVRYLPSSPSIPSQPPPYHIAAAYSKKAAFFNTDVQSRSSVSSLPPFSLPGGRLTPLSEIKDMARPSSAASSKYDFPPTLGNHSIKELSWTSSQSHEPQDKSSTTAELQEINGNVEKSINEFNLVEEQRDAQKLSITQPERQLKTLVDSISPKIDTNDSSMSTYQNISSVSSMNTSPLLESPDIQTKISVASQELNQSFSPETIITQSSRSMEDSFSNNSEPIQFDQGSSMKSSLSEDDDQQLCDNSSNILSGTSPEVSSVASSQLSEMVSNTKPLEYLVEKNHTTSDLLQESQKSVTSRIPVSRTKVVARSANEEIREISLGKPPNFTQDKPSAGTHLIAPTPQRVNAILPHNSGLEGVKDNAPSLNNSYGDSNKSENTVVTSSRIPSVSGIPSPKTSPNWQQSSSPPYFTSKVPQPGFSIAKRSSITSPAYGNSRQGTLASPVQHGVESSLPKAIPSATQLSKIPQLSGQTNSSLGSGGRITPSKGSEHLEKSPKSLVASSKIPTLSPARSDVSPVADAAGKSRIPISPQNRPIKNWMFGLHKNAMVFPVSIHKNPGLGFSIAGGHHHNTSPDKQDSGIYITKIHPNGPASATLQPGDKILEVDGIDFTKLEHDQAVSVLTQTGSVVQMMISRQQ